MNGKDLLYAGLAIGAVYAVYKLVTPLSKGVGTAAEGLGEGISTIAEGAGTVATSVGEVTQGVSSPFQFLDKYLQGISDIQQQRNIDYANAYTTSQVKETINDTVGATEKSNYNVASKGESQTYLQLAKQNFETDTSLTALQANKSETIQRKTEYGFGGSGFISKTFLPTTDVAQARQQGLKSSISNLTSTVKKSVVSTVKNVGSALTSLFKKK